MNMNSLLAQVKDAIQNHTTEQNRQPGDFDPTALVQQIEQLFHEHQQQHAMLNGDHPQGMDPYGGLPNEAGPFEPGNRTE